MIILFTYIFPQLEKSSHFSLNILQLCLSNTGYLVCSRLHIEVSLFNAESHCYWNKSLVEVVSCNAVELTFFVGSSWSLEKKKETRWTANILMYNTHHHENSSTWFVDEFVLLCQCTTRLQTLQSNVVEKHIQYVHILRHSLSLPGCPSSLSRDQPPLYD